MKDDLDSQQEQLWLDRPDAEELLKQRLANGELTREGADRLREFALNGYLVVEIEELERISRELRTEVDRIWNNRPVDLAYVFVDRPASMADSSERGERMAPTRILDIHSHSEAAFELYLNRQIFKWARSIFDGDVVAFESSFSEFGWSEPPCRDAVYFEIDPPDRMLTAWIPLEEIRMESGPPYLIPGSHRLPLYEFEPGRFRIKPDEDYLPAHRFVLGHAQQAGLEPVELLLKQGQAVLWHPLMVHGARRILRPGVTRRALTVRLTTPDAVSARKASFWKTVRGSLWRKDRRLFWNETERLLEREGCCGFDNPLRGMNPRGLTLAEKVRGLFAPGKG